MLSKVEVFFTNIITLRGPKSIEREFLSRPLPFFSLKLERRHEDNMHHPFVTLTAQLPLLS